MNLGITLLFILIICFYAYGGVATLTKNTFLRDDAPPEEQDRYLGKRYAPYVHPMKLIVVVCFVILIEFALVQFAPYSIAPVKLIWFCSTMIRIGFYDGLLWALTPALRKRISARGIAVLWILPNSLYLSFFWTDFCNPPIVIRADEELLFRLLAIWGIGAFATMAWYCLSHLRFRNALLCDAAPISSKAEAVLREEEKRIGMEKPFRAVVSEKIQTPLSIGVLKRSKCIVLPDFNYTERELSLIFRHELIHLRHEDCAAKMFLCFSTAISWWNPFVWLAMRKSAEELELACDQMALAGADDATRREYAELLLASSGEHRGFTTCLSASATALHYRLRSVLHPVKKSDGIHVAAILFVLLFLSSSPVVGFAYREQPLSNAIEDFTGGLFDNYTGEDWTIYPSTLISRTLTRDELDKLTEALSSCRVYDTYVEDPYDICEYWLSISPSDRTVSVEGEAPEDNPHREETGDELRLLIYSHKICLHLHDSGEVAQFYATEEDLQALKEALEEIAGE